VLKEIGRETCWREWGRNGEIRLSARNKEMEERKKRRMWETCGGLDGWRKIHHHHHLLKSIIIHFRQHINMNFLICSLKVTSNFLNN
jgi:hypothetical protein